MKTIAKILACLMLLTLLLPAGALAMTQEEWDLSSTLKTTKQVNVYSYASGSPEVIDTIPAGTYCKYSDSGIGIKAIKYMKDGEIRSGWVDETAIVRCTTQIRISDGMADNVHEKDPDYNKKVTKENTIYVAPSLLIDSAEDKAPNSATSATTSASVANTAATALTTTATTSAKPDPELEPKEIQQTSTTQGDVSVTINTLGSVFSTITHNGSTYEVATADLNFGKDMPEDKKLAVIYTPKTGKATLRRSASNNADMLKQCKAGTLVSVLEYGETYCLINYKNTNGYILTDCLKFHGVAAQTEGKGVLSYNGKTNGGTTVNIRNAANKGSAKIGEWKTGTEVTVWGHEDGWYEIETNGMRGFVLEEFLTIRE